MDTPPSAIPPTEPPYWREFLKSRTRLLAAAACAVCLAGVLVAVLVQCHRAIPPDKAGPVGPNATSPANATIPAVLDANARKIDAALLQGMASLGRGAESLQPLETRTLQAGGQTYSFTSLAVRLPKTPNAFLAWLDKNLGQWVGNAALSQVNATLWRISVLEHPTHELQFRYPLDSTQPPFQEIPARAAQLAVVIDDMGESVSFARELASLPYPVTFSVWPLAMHAREAANIAHEAGREVIVHQPMEPVGYPTVNPGPGAVLMRASSKDVREIVGRNLGRVPHAVGLNNHMGSKFTQDAAAVRPVLEELAARKLFALDSLTHPASKLAREAGKMGVPVLVRDVFLDVARERRAILAQLNKAAHVAQRKGYAVAIGHPHPETLAALEEWADARDNSVQLVTLAALLRKIEERAKPPASGNSAAPRAD